MGERAEWQEMLQRRAQGQRRVDPHSDQKERVAAILAGKLGKSDEWDRFKEHVAAKMAICERNITAAQMVLLSSGDVNHEHLMRAKIEMHSWQARLEAYKDSLLFPERFEQGVDGQDVDVV